MLIPQNSNLREVYKKVGVDEKRKLFLEGIIFIVDTIDQRYQSMTVLLQPDAPDMNNAMRDAWVIIDNLYRLRLVIDSASGFDKSRPPFQLTFRKLIPVEPMRHFIEHYDRSLHQIYKDVKPLVGHLGYLKLLDNKRMGSVFAIPGSLRKFKGLGLVNPAGKSMRHKVDHVTLYLGEDSVDISDIYYQLGDFLNDLDTYIATKW
jgi:hypothetical protein